MAVPRSQAPLPSFTATWHSTSYASISPFRPALSAAGKAIFITGGGTGIGARTALSFAAAGAAHIALFGRREAKLRETQARVQAAHSGVQVHVFSGDVTVEKEVDGAMAAFSKAVGGGGKLHVLVSNAAAGDLCLFSDVEDETAARDWWFVVEVNLRGHANAVRAFFRHGAVEDAVVVNVSSAGAFVTAFPGLTAYAAGKAGAVAMNTALQYEHPRKMIVSVQPGVVDTWMQRKSGYPALDDVSLPADFCMWLASPEARFLKGTFLFANWDVDELKARAKEIEGTGTLQLWPTGLARKNEQGDTTVFDSSRDPSGMQFDEKA